jgi:RNA polymerase sigma factor (sigma-70 family)
MGMRVARFERIRHNAGGRRTPRAWRDEPVPDTQRYLQLKARLRPWAAARSRRADEVVDEAFARAVDHAEGGAPLRSYVANNPQHDVEFPDWPFPRLLAFLRGFVRFIVIEDRRRRGEEPLNDGVADVVDGSANLLERLIQKERDEIFDECLAALDGNYRAAVAMRLDGSSYKEIAATLGVKTTTVTNRITRGIKDLTDRVRARMTHRPAPPTIDDEDQS